jgi:hypothetical protein
MLRNSRGQFLGASELFPLLGFKRGGHLPSEGFEPREVDGVMFRCDPAHESKVNSWGRTVGSSKHRIHYLCKACDKWIPYGRAHQHVKGREHKLNHEIMVGRP